jgi:beta-glucanase (GH16 family)
MVKMKIDFKLICLVFLLIMTSCSAKREPGNTAPSWKLAWADEFDGSSIDPNAWGFELGSLYGGWGNNELEYYTSRTCNANVEGGNLVIQAIAESYSGYNYTSARMITKGKMSRQYGKIEARMKLPYGQGIWPAFWMMGDNFTWPACGEIDIMEMIGGGSGRDNRTFGTGHWDDGGHQMSGGNITPVVWPGKLSNDYHVYGIEWNAGSIKWFVDGTQFFELGITPAAMSELHQPHFLLLNLAVGGNWPGIPDGTTVFPQVMYVDYVRWYEWK